MAEDKQPLPPGVSISLTAIESPDLELRCQVRTLPAYLGAGEDMDVTLPDTAAESQALIAAATEETQEGPSWGEAAGIGYVYPEFVEQVMN